MSKKPNKVTQVRIAPDLAKRIDEMRDNCEFDVSRNSFVETLLYRGIEFSKGVVGESTFKK